MNEFGNWGLTQQQRFPIALAENYVQLDERSIEQLMAMMPRYAKLLNFYDLSGNVSGDWSAFFKNDIVYLLADMCVSPTAVDETKHPFPPEPTSDALLLRQIHIHASRINYWHHRAKLHNENHLNRPNTPISMALNTIIQCDLALWLARIKTSQHAPYWISLTDLQTTPFAEIWNIGRDTDQDMDMQTALAAFQGGIKKLSIAAQSDLQDILKQSNLLPHTTLLLAFLQIYKTLQTDMNGFTQNYLNYYYGDVLGLSPAAATPDTALLAFELSSDCDQYLLLAGTSVNAGNDSAGAAITFATKQDILLNTCKIISLRNLHLERATAGSAVLGIAASLVADSADGLGAPVTPPEMGWSTFGTGYVAPNAELGFTIASSALLLEQGNRAVNLIFSFCNTDATSQLEAYAASVSQCTGTTTTPEQALAGAFLLYFSGTEGWCPIDLYTFTPANDGSENWVLGFTLSNGDPSIVANTSLLPDVQGWPMFKLLLKPDAAVYAYSSLLTLRINSLQLHVSVEGFAEAEVLTSSGDIAQGTAFPPFGPVPACGAYVRIANLELSAKKLLSATVKFNWQQLPPEEGGFKVYYAGYGNFNFDNTVFTVDAACYSNGRWIDLTSPYQLFAEDSTNTLLQQTQFSFDLAGTPWSYTSYLDALTQGAPTIVPGTLQLVLKTPTYAFGNAIYPRLFAQAAIENIKIIEQEIYPRRFAKAAIKNILNVKENKPCKNIEPAPIIMLNPPFMPMLASILVDYTACDTIALSTSADNVTEPLQFYLNGPFGYAPAEESTPPLFPTFSDNGYLYIGLSELVAPQMLNLHFQFKVQTGDSSTLAKKQLSSPITWRYLAKNQWYPFATANVYSDTANFTCSGIVSLQIPGEISAGNTLMPDLSSAGTFWIEACTGSDPIDYNNTVAILAQTIEASRVIVEGTPPEALPLPAGTIQALTQEISQIKSVNQPYPSVGGSAAESAQQYETRVSERLKHKQRAILPIDYEQIVLADFPSVWQARCIGANRSRHYPPAARVKAGCIVLAIAPPIVGNPELSDLFDDSVLTVITDHMQALASPAVVSVVTRNIVSEQIKVIVGVCFGVGEDSGLCLQKLNDTLVRFLSPWCDERLPHLNIGCDGVDVDQIAALIYSQPYVSQQSAVRLSHSVRTGLTHKLHWSSQGQKVRPSTPWSVLVPAQQHGIRVGTADALPPEPIEGIGSMVTGSDFTISSATNNGSRIEQSPMPDKHYVLALSLASVQAAQGNKQI